MLYFTNPPALSDEEQEKFQRILDRYVHDALFTSTTPLECVRAVHRLIQQNVIYPRQRLRMEGAVGVRMSGSGSTIFGAFESADAAQKAHEALPGSVLARTIVQ